MKFLKVLLFILIGLAPTYAKAQILNPTHWTFSTERNKVEKGDVIDLVIKAELDENWHLYSNDFDPNVGPKVSKLIFNKGTGFELVGKTKPIGAEDHYDDVFGGNVRIFHKKAEFRQKVKILSTVNITGTYETQACSDLIGKCVDQDGDFSFGLIEVEATNPENANSVGAEKSSPSTPITETKIEERATENIDSEDVALSKAADAVVVTKNSDLPEISKTPAPADSGSLWGFFFAAFLSGLVALLTPCVFPMIPMTVTFFTRQSKSRSEGIRNASLYGLSIIVLYVLIGTIVSRINGPEFANFISTHWAPNLFFFLIFIFFGLSFLGLFEIVLPSSIVNMADKQSDKGGIVGIFFMAFTIVLVSFSCTGPIVGSILVQSAGGEVLKPIVGMFGYSLAFALPFTLFAIFPQWLSSLPKSGGWLNSVKVVLGFLELAFALKFLSIADQAYHWHILDREVYLSFWIVIFSMIGFYLLGKIRLPHDSPMEKIPVLRVSFAIIVFSFVVYMIPGMWGAPLKSLAGYLPPESTLDFNIEALIGKKVGNSSNQTTETKLCDYPKHADILHLPHGLEGYFDLKQALACAKQQNKPLFIDFTGHGCVNCREMEARVWANPEVMKRLENDFVVTALYVDDKTELPESQWYTSTYDHKVKKTIGKQNADLQVKNYKSNSQPLYFLLGPDGNLLTEPRSYDLDIEGFVKFLEEGKTAFKGNSPL